MGCVVGIINRLHPGVGLNDRILEAAVDQAVAVRRRKAGMALHHRGAVLTTVATLLGPDHGASGPVAHGAGRMKKW